MKQPGLDGRHRDKNGQISQKHGNTKVKTLRKIYCASFAPNQEPNAKLKDVLDQLDEPSLTRRRSGRQDRSWQIAPQQNESPTRTA